jgi:hypothetical protein
VVARTAQAGVAAAAISHAAASFAPSTGRRNGNATFADRTAARLVTVKRSVIRWSCVATMDLTGRAG